jgi:small subunit ribosomal protein S9
MAKTNTKEKYFEAVGRRKSATARVRITPADKFTYTVNGKKLDEAFDLETLQLDVQSPFKEVETSKEFSVSAKVMGGGIVSQAEAIRLGIARALVKFNEDLRPNLKHAGFLKRDPRIKERKKFGKKKARKSPQWSKR